MSPAAPIAAATSSSARPAGSTSATRRCRSARRHKKRRPPPVGRAGAPGGTRGTLGNQKTSGRVCMLRVVDRVLNGEQISGVSTHRRVLEWKCGGAEGAFANRAADIPKGAGTGGAIVRLMLAIDDVIT